MLGCATCPAMKRVPGLIESHYRAVVSTARKGFEATHLLILLIVGTRSLAGLQH